MASKASRVDVVGPLEAYQAGFETVLADAGYTPLSAANQVRLMRHLSIWLEARDLEASDLTPAVIQEYLANRRADGYTCWLSLRGLTPLLTYLRGLGVAPAPAPPDLSDPVDELFERYRRYLVEERGLVPTTVRYYLADAREFLAGLGRRMRVAAGRARRGRGDRVRGCSECARRSVGLGEDPGHGAAVAAAVPAPGRVGHEST